MSEIIAVIPAAGSGQRMGANQNKAFMKLAGESVIRRTLKAFLMLESVKQICLLVNPFEAEIMAKHIRDIDNPLKTEINIVHGGETRQDSVRLGLEFIVKNKNDLFELQADPDNLYKEIKFLYQSGEKRTLCLVHDGARCLVSKKLLEGFISTLKEDFFGLGVAVPVQDTIRIIDKDDNIIETPERASLRAMQTPQGSDLQVLLRAHRYAKENQIRVTDDIAVLEAINYPVKLYSGEMRNIKITHPEDMEIAEKLLKIE